MENNVLIVSNDTPIVNILGMYLQQENYTLHWYITVLKAIEEIGNIPDIQIIISDIMLKGTTGIELYDWCREQKKYKNIPFMFITPLNRTSEISKRLRKDNNLLYIQKPIDPESVVQVIEMKLLNSF